jgi:outer membrane protein OmpA-like peptidoglycan-associated protein
MRRFFWGFIFLILWDTVCIYWFVCGIKNLCEQPKQEEVVVAVEPPPPPPPPEPTPPPKPEPEKPLVLTDTYFIFERGIVKNMEDLIASSKQTLAYLSRNPESKVYITGYTSDAEDSDLGMSRAEIIKNYMISQGVPGNMFVLDSKGTTEAKAPNNTPENKMLNRRVHITVK